MTYAVTCLEKLDNGLTTEARIEATFKRFKTRTAAEKYMRTVAKSRDPEIVTCCHFCGGKEWRTFDHTETGDYPRCINCGAC